MKLLNLRINILPSLLSQVPLPHPEEECILLSGSYKIKIKFNFLEIKFIFSVEIKEYSNTCILALLYSRRFFGTWESKN